MNRLYCIQAYVAWFHGISLRSILSFSSRLRESNIRFMLGQCKYTISIGSLGMSLVDGNIVTLTGQSPVL